MSRSRNNKTKELTKKLKEQKEVTKEELKKYKGFENISDEEANNVLTTLKTLAEILLTIKV